MTGMATTVGGDGREALPIAGVKATPNFYSEREYYAAPIDELRTYPAYAYGREPKGYLDWVRKQGRRLIEGVLTRGEQDQRR